jgi:hypothetical protein
VYDLLPPPKSTGELGYKRPAREPAGVPPTEWEVAEFTRKVTAFFKEAAFFDWLWRTSHGLDAAYDPGMMSYKLWWQDTGMRREGDTVVFFHRGRAENILKRSVKVMSNAISAYLLTGDPRAAEIATEYLKGVVALSKGLERGIEKPVVKYLQARAVFNHNHSYTADGRKAAVDYSGACVESYKWNVHVFEIPDNPTYGTIWVSNMRSKDDVPYLYMSLQAATAAYYQTKDPKLADAAKLYIEYVRGFSQSIVDNDWDILTKYGDGAVSRQLDFTKEGHPEADLGSFVYWESLFGPDAECNAQLGAALTGYGVDLGKKDCLKGNAGRDFEIMAEAGNYFNYNIYNYFHIGALAAANAWNRTAIAGRLMEGMAQRFDAMMHDTSLPNRSDHEYQSDMAGWLISAATHGFPLTAEEARHVMDWYGMASDWYRKWPHWDPWKSMKDGETLDDYIPPRDETVDDGKGGKTILSHIRQDEMPYIFEYCFSPLRDREGVRFIDCDLVADPSRW